MKLRSLAFTAVLLLTASIALFGCSKATQTGTELPNTEPGAQETTSEAIKTVSIIDQVRQSQHYKMFPTLIAEKENNSSFDYSDACLRCHSETAIIRDSNAKMNDFFTGGKYEKDREGITCLVCHTMGGEKMISLRYTGWESCTTCHTSGGITLGKEVHHSQKEMIEGIGVGDVPSKPSYKWAAMQDTFSCTDCHVTNGLKHDFMVPGVTATYDALGTTRLNTEMDFTEFAKMFKQDKCITCHYDPSNTINKIRQRQDEITKKIDALKPQFESWEKKIELLDPKDPKVAQFNDAQTYYTYVTSDASKGSHNYALSKALLEQAEVEITKLK